MNIPHYAEHVLEVVRTIILRVPYESRYRMVRLEVSKHLKGVQVYPFIVRMFIQRGEYYGPWEEPEGYPALGGNDAEAALERFLEEVLPEYAEIARGIDNAK